MAFSQARRVARWIDIGKMRHRVTFSRRDRIDDGYGNEVSGPWVDQFTVFAAVQVRLGGEAVEAARLAGQQPYQVVVRQDEKTRQIKTEWRAVDEDSGTELAIISIIDNDDRRAYFELLCQSGVAP
jgi:SPP1 family predicted phage head-tail adaptor